VVVFLLGLKLKALGMFSGVSVEKQTNILFKIGQ
jgi:hypothetical protein